MQLHLSNDPILASVRLTCFIGLLLATPLAIGAAAGPVSVSGDLQLRYESSDSTQPGVQRQVRLRSAAHLLLDWSPAAGATLRVGGRSGSLSSHQSASFTLATLDRNHGYGTRTAYLDRWELDWRGEGWRAVLGRSVWPFWSVTDYLWDGDVNPAGAFASREWATEAGTKTTLSGAVYALPDGGLRFTGRAGILALRQDRPWGAGRLRYGVQWMQLEGEPNARYTLSRPHERDYRIGQVSIQYSSKWAGQPASVGLDVFHNFKTYSATGPDLEAAAFRDERSGFGLGLSWGQNKATGDWRLRYNYAWQEALSASPALSEESLSRMSFTNYRGHDFRFIYSLHPDLTATLRAMLVEQIVGPSRSERYRLDLQWAF